MSNPPDSRTTTTGPAGIPRGVPPAPADACVNFNLPDGRVVCLSVPQLLGDLDAAFILAIVQAYIAAVVTRRGR